MKQISEELREAKEQGNVELEYELQQLADRYGDRSYFWYLVRTAFHGGGRISKHYTASSAVRAAKKARVKGCTCGCAIVVHDIHYITLLEASETTDPRAPAR